MDFDIFIVQGYMVPRSQATALLIDQEWQGDPASIGHDASI